MISHFRVVIDEVAYEVERKGDQITINGHDFQYNVEGNTVHLSGAAHSVNLLGKTAVIDGIRYAFESFGLDEKRQATRKKAPSQSAAEEAGVIPAIMPGLILKILKKEGDVVEAGEVVLILEAMKMQNELQAPKSGTIRRIHVKVGDSVEMRQVLVSIE